MDSCSRMVVQLNDIYDPDKAKHAQTRSSSIISHVFFPMLNISFTQVKIRIKIVSGSPSGVVAAEAKRIQATWVILDK